MRLRIEYDGFESRQLLALIGKKRDIPTASSRIDYLMMRSPKMNNEDCGADSELGEDLEESKDEMPSALSSALAFSRSQTSNLDASGRARNFSMLKPSGSVISMMKLRQSVKVNFKSQETLLRLKSLSMIKKQRSLVKSADSSGKKDELLDLEETRQKQEFVNQMRT